jgi:chromosome segregation ATPase
MKIKIKEALKTAYKNAGFSDKALDGLAEHLATSVTEESQIEQAITGVEPLLKVFQSETDRVRTEKTAVEKKLAELEGKKPAEPKGEEGLPDYVKEMRDANKRLEERLAAFEGEKVANQRKAQLAAAMEKAPDQLRTRYEKDLARMTFNSDEEYAEWLTEVKADTDAIVADAVSKGAVFTRPAGGGGTPPPEKPSAEVEARIAARAAEQEAAAIKGLPTK